MILITATINEEIPGGPIFVRFSGQDIMGSSNAEADIADELRRAMVAKRDEIFAGKGWNKEELKHSYMRGFDTPEERDQRHEAG